MRFSKKRKSITLTLGPSQDFRQQMGWVVGEIKGSLGPRGRVTSTADSQRLINYTESFQVASCACYCLALLFLATCLFLLWLVRVLFSLFIIVIPGVKIAEGIY